MAASSLSPLAKALRFQIGGHSYDQALVGALPLSAFFDPDFTEYIDGIAQTVRHDLNTTADLSFLADFEPSLLMDDFDLERPKAVKLQMLRDKLGLSSNRHLYSDEQVWTPVDEETLKGNIRSVENLIEASKRSGAGTEESKQMILHSLGVTRPSTDALTDEGLPPNENSSNDLVPRGRLAQLIQRIVDLRKEYLPWTVIAIRLKIDRAKAHLFLRMSVGLDPSLIKHLDKTGEERLPVSSAKELLCLPFDQ
jgi:hypothetical protein